MWKRGDQVTTAMLRRLPDASLIALFAAVATRMEPIGRGVAAMGGRDWDVERHARLMWGWAGAPGGKEPGVVLGAFEDPPDLSPSSSAVERASFALHRALLTALMGARGVDGVRDRELFEFLAESAGWVAEVYGQNWPWLVAGERTAQLSDVGVLRSGGRLSAAGVRESAAYQERLQAEPGVWLDLPAVAAPPQVGEDLDDLVGKVEALLPRLSDRSLGGLLWVWAVACSVEAEFASRAFEVLVEECLAAVAEWVVSGQLGGEAVERLRSFPRTAAQEGFVPGAGSGEAVAVVRLVVAASRLIVAEDSAGARDEVLVVARGAAWLDSVMLDVARRLARVKVPSSRLLDRLAVSVTQ